jgi:hypothetical protein
MQHGKQALFPFCTETTLLRKEERYGVNMKHSGKYNGWLTEYERSISRARFYEDPLRWIGKWMLGRIVCVLYKAIHFALFIGYYDFFRPWRKLAP